MHIIDALKTVLQTFKSYADKNATEIRNSSSLIRKPTYVELTDSDLNFGGTFDFVISTNDFFDISGYVDICNSDGENVASFYVDNDTDEEGNIIPQPQTATCTVTLEPGEYTIVTYMASYVIFGHKQRMTREVDLFHELGDGKDAIVSQKAITEEFDKVRTQVDRVRTQVIDEAKNSYANVLKGNKSGSIVALTDLSPVGHNLNTVATVINLFNPLCHTKEHIKGVDIQYLQDEDCFLLNGTKEAGGNNVFSLLEPIAGVAGDKYTISATYVSGTVTMPAGAYAVAYFGAADNPGYNAANWESVNLRNNNASASAALTKNYITAFWFFITSGVVFDNYKVKIQLEKGTTATAYTPHVQNLSAVKVKRYGKNLCELGTVTFTKTADYVLEYPITCVGKSIRFSANIITTDTDKEKVLMYIYDKEGAQIGGGIGVSKDKNSTGFRSSVYISKPTANIAKIRFYASEDAESATGDTATFKDIQIELASSNYSTDLPTTYEPFVVPTEHAVNADGTVDGVKSLYPSMTLMTDTDGATLDVSYNRDINKAFAELQNALISLGGNV